MAEMSCLAVGGEVDHYGQLPPPAVALWQTIAQFQTKRWANADSTERRGLDSMTGCLEKLSGTLQQVARMHSHHEELKNAARQLPKDASASGAWRAAPVLADFEGMLLQGRAALDRLAWFVSKSFKNPCSSYRKLPNVLVNFRNDERAKNLLALYDQSAQMVNGLYAQIDAPESLRDLVGHMGAAIEGVQTCFAGFLVDPTRVLLVDCELHFPGLERPIAVFESARASAQHIGFLVLGSLALFSDSEPIALKDCIPAWRNDFVPLSDFVLHEPDGTPLSNSHITYVKRMTPDGFEAVTYNVDASLWKQAVVL